MENSKMAEETNSTEQRNIVFDYVKTMLGDGMIDVELDPKHYEVALDRAINRYRQRSSNAVEESWLFLELIQDQNEYRLPDEVIEVREVFRRSIGSRSGLGAGGTLFEPFNLAYTNTYLLSGTMMGGLATYEMFAGYQKLVGRMFGSYIEYKWKQQSHLLTILQRPFAQGEQVLIRTYNYRPDFVLLTDLYAKQWLRDFTLATCKLMLGEARSKFGTVTGPGSGGVQLNGATLKTEGTTELEKLEKEIINLESGGIPYSFVLG